MDAGTLKWCGAVQHRHVSSAELPHVLDHTGPTILMPIVVVFCSVWSINIQHNNIVYYALCKSSTRPGTAENWRMYAAHGKDESITL